MIPTKAYKESVSLRRQKENAPIGRLIDAVEHRMPQDAALVSILRECKAWYFDQTYIELEK